jgi:hypothetical protein
MLRTTISSRSPFVWLAFIVFVALVYVANAWTPSSYSLVLNSVGASSVHPALGQPQAIRSDEYAVQTPHFQMAVLSGFNETEKVSPYQETMKSFIAYPIKDWSIVFKPQLWAFFALPPAYAYSAYFCVLSVAFIIGWYLFLCQLGTARQYAAIGSILLFFSHFTQVWWTTNAASFAFAPWVAIAFMAPRSQLVRAAFVAYASTVWLFGLLYPPFLYGMALTMAVAILAFRPDTLRLKNVAITVTSSVLAGAIVFYYMYDVIEVMRNTVYPGQRSVAGGTAPPLQVIATFFPYINTFQFDPSIIRPDLINECEAGAVSSFLVVMILCLAELRSIKQFIKNHQRPLAILAIGMGICIAWMLLPIPAKVGHLVLLDMVPPRRLLLAFGFMVQIAAIFMLPHLRWSLSLHRVLNFLAAVILAFVVSKNALPWQSLKYSWFDIAVIPPFLIAVYLAKRTALRAYAGQLLMAVAAFTNIVTFGGFNPLQSATPIFDNANTAAIKDLKDLQSLDLKGRVYINGWYGATLPGLGIKAINDTPMSPQLSNLKSEFSYLPADVQNLDFNRYAHIIPSFIDEPTVEGDKLFLPLQHFARNDGLARATIGDDLRWDGSADTYSVLRQRDGSYMAEIAGWGDFSHVNRQQRIEYADPDITPIGLSRDLRPDVAAAEKDQSMNLAGFRAYFGIPNLDRELQIRLAASDPKTGGSRIPNLTTLSVSKFVDEQFQVRKVAGKGFIDSITVAPKGANVQLIKITGWFPFPQKEGQHARLVTNADVSSASIQRVYRKDLQAQFGQNWAMSGFSASLTVQGPADIGTEGLCVIIHDPDEGYASLTESVGNKLCKKF